MFATPVVVLDFSSEYLYCDRLQIVRSHNVPIVIIMLIDEIVGDYLQPIELYWIVHYYALRDNCFWFV